MTDPAQILAAAPPPANAVDLDSARAKALIDAGDIAGAMRTLGAMLAPATPYDPGGEHIVDIFDGDLPDPDWIVPGLQLCAGRPNAIVSYSGLGKTLSAHALALAVCTGRDVWGEFSVPRPRRVLLLDMEQGKVATLRRLRRLAHGMGLTSEDLRGRIEVRTMARVSLLRDDAEATLRQLTEGFDFVIFDSLKKLISGAKENEAEIETYVSKLLRVSEETGRCFLLLIHTGKESAERSGLESIRGSSAIAGDLGSAFLLKRKNKRITVEHVKASVAADGGIIEDFAIEFVDVAHGADPRAGLRVRYVSDEEARERDSRDRKAGKVGRLGEAILAFVATHPGASANEIEMGVKGRREDVRDARKDLLADNRLRTAQRPGRGGGSGFFLGSNFGPDGSG